MKKNLYKLDNTAKSNTKEIEELSNRNFKKAIESNSAKSGIKK